MIIELCDRTKDTVITYFRATRDPEVRKYGNTCRKKLQQKVKHWLILRKHSSPELPAMVARSI